MMLVGMRATFLSGGRVKLAGHALEGCECDIKCAEVPLTMAFARSVDRGEFNRSRLATVAQQFEELQHSAETLAAAGEVSLDNFNWWYQRLNALVLVALGEREELRKELLTRASRRREG